MIRAAVLNTLRQIGAIPDPGKPSHSKAGAGSDANQPPKSSDPAQLPTNDAREQWIVDQIRKAGL